MKKIDENNFKEVVEKVRGKYNIGEEEAIKYIFSLGPKKMSRMELFEEVKSWRAGYTKPTIEARKANNRKKEKNRRKASRRNRMS